MSSYQNAIALFPKTITTRSWIREKPHNNKPFSKNLIYYIMLVNGNSSLPSENRVNNFHVTFNLNTHFLQFLVQTLYFRQSLYFLHHLM